MDGTVFKAAVVVECTRILALLARRLERHEGIPLSLLR